jgi:circadian clock protein KaiC
VSGRTNELDHVLGGGPPIGTTTLLAGAPGVGKTTLGLFWALADARPDAQTLFVTFAEHAEQLVRKARAFGLDLPAAQADRRIRILPIPPASLDPDWVAAQVLGELASGAVRRIVFDDITILVDELGDRTRDYVSTLNNMVYRANITALYLLEIKPFEGLRVELTNTPLAVLGDNVIVVQQYAIQGQLRRLLAVLRMRLSFFDRTPHVFQSRLCSSIEKVLRARHSMAFNHARNITYSLVVLSEDLANCLILTLFELYLAPFLPHSIC